MSNNCLGHQWFAYDFHEWPHQEWKSLSNLLMGHLKIIVHAKPYIILFLTHYFMSWVHKPTKNNHQSLNLPSPRTIFSYMLQHDTRWQEIDICDCYSLLNINFAQFVHARIIKEYDLTTPIPLVCMLSQIKCGDVTMLGLKTLSMAKWVISDWF